MTVQQDQQQRARPHRAPKLIITGGLVLGLLAAALVGYWFWAAYQLETGLGRWADKQRSRGFEITHGPLELDGFPFRVTARLAAPSVVSPDGWRWQTEELRAEAAAWRPLSLDVTMSGHHDIEGPNGFDPLAIDLGRARLTAELTLQGELLQARLNAQDVTAGQAGHHPLSMSGLNAALGPLRKASGNGQQELDLRLSAINIEHAELAKTPLKGPISELRLDGTLYGDIPRTRLRKALHIWRDSGGFLSLHDAGLNWGPLLLESQGRLELDKRLRPAGTLDSRIEGATEVVKLLERQGQLSRGESFGLKLTFSALGKTNAQGRNEINVPLVLRDGRLSVGPVALLRLPPVVR